MEEVEFDEPYLLNQLQAGDIFTFKAGQEALYEIKNGGWQALETNGHTEYEVLKKNKTSVKVRVGVAGIEYTFKFKGFFAGYQREGQDCFIIKK